MPLLTTLPAGLNGQTIGALPKTQSGFGSQLGDIITGGLQNFSDFASNLMQIKLLNKANQAGLTTTGTGNGNGSSGGGNAQQNQQPDGFLRNFPDWLIPTVLGVVMIGVVIVLLRD